MKYQGTLNGADGSLIIIALDLNVIDGGHVVAIADMGLQPPVPPVEPPTPPTHTD